MAKKKVKRGNGEGCISQRKDGKWVAVATTGRDPETGKLARKFIYGRTRQEVSEQLTKTLNDIQHGIYVDSKLTLGEWLDIWLKEYAKPHIRPSTFKSYEEQIRLHIKPFLGTIQLKKLQPGQVQKMYNERLANGKSDGKGGLSPRSVQIIHAALHSALKQALKEGLVVRNVTEATKLPRREKREPRVLSIEEQNQFMDILDDDRLGVAFLLDLGTGLRVGELLGLRWQDVNLDDKVIRVKQAISRVRNEDGPTKTMLQFQSLKTEKSQRSIPMPDYIAAKLKQHKAKQNQERLRAGSGYQNLDLVFCSELGQPVDPRNFTRKFYQLIAKAGLKRTNLHALRHTYATRLLEMNEHPKVVQELLGHSQISLTLDTYSHVLPELKQAAAQKLNSVFENGKQSGRRTN